MFTFFEAFNYPHISLVLLPNSRTFIGPGLDESPAKASISKNPIGEVISCLPTTRLADYHDLHTDDSVTEPESEVERADKVGHRLLTYVC
jgi:hypothetical protein